MAPDELDHKDVLFEQALNFLSGAFCNLKGQKALAQMGALALLPVTVNVDNRAAALPPAPPLEVAAQAPAPQPHCSAPGSSAALSPMGCHTKEDGAEPPCPVGEVWQ